MYHIPTYVQQTQTRVHICSDIFFVAFHFSLCPCVKFNSSLLLRRLLLFRLLFFLLVFLFVVHFYSFSVFLLLIFSFSFLLLSCSSLEFPYASQPNNKLIIFFSFSNVSVLVLSLFSPSLSRDYFLRAPLLFLPLYCLFLFG